MGFFDIISQEDLKLNTTEKKILDYLLEHINQISTLKISKISDEMFLAPNSIIRFCKKLGYTGFSQMKYDMEKVHQKETVNKQDHWLGSREMISETLHINRPETIRNVAQLMYDSEHLVFFGLGLSRLPADDLAKRMRYLNKLISVPDDRDNCIQYARSLKKGQIAFFFSYSGNTDIITKLAQIVKTKDIPVISMTGISQNTLTNYSKYKLYAYVNKMEYQGADISSRSAFYLVTDLIFHEYLRIKQALVE